MGGFGSGRQGWKATTSDMRTLDIRKLQRDGLLTPGQAFVVLQVGGVWQSVKCTWTPCNFGGRRAWFVCPAMGCGRRVAILYGGSIFACRHCYRLAYPSQRETDVDRAMRRADAIRRRLGWEPGILNGDGGKPKGMHWRTFERMKAEHDALVVEALADLPPTEKI
jgi:hypothetical protein